MFDLKLDSKHNLVFSGYGKGHGLGLSQWGAKALADNKKDYKGILAHYYQNTKLKKLY
jgi:stage II sporulation protein D